MTALLLSLMLLQDDQKPAETPSDATPVVAEVDKKEAPKPKPVPSSLEEVNRIRKSRGLHPFVLDESIQKKANERIRMVYGYTHHPGGSFFPARYEGVGGGNRFNTCYLYNYFPPGTKAGAASRQWGGTKLHILLVR